MKSRHLENRIDGLRDLVDERESRAQERHEALKESIGQALLTSDKAVTAAAKALDARVTLLNELRQVVETQSHNFATKTEIAYVREAITKLENKSSERTGVTVGAGQSWHVLGWGLAALGALAGVIALARTM